MQSIWLRRLNRLSGNRTQPRGTGFRPSRAVAPRRSTAAEPRTRAPLPELEGPQWELVKRIAASRGFERSSLLTNFLLFACHRALSGEAATINEQQIGVHVFGRQAEFNRTDDNIVRDYARMLRRRIDDYFRNEGRDEPLIVHIPRGGYVPLFAQRPWRVKKNVAWPSRFPH